MLNSLQKGVLKLFAALISFLAVFTVNSTCAMALGQPKEPSSLNRLKKIKG